MCVPHAFHGWVWVGVVLPVFIMFYIFKSFVNDCTGNRMLLSHDKYMDKLQYLLSRPVLSCKGVSPKTTIRKSMNTKLLDWRNLLFFGLTVGNKGLGLVDIIISYIVLGVAILSPS